MSRRQRRQFKLNEYFEDLMLLRELDSQGRVPGAAVCEADEALDYVRHRFRSLGFATGAE